jgi:hypothetical protein
MQRIEVKLGQSFGVPMEPPDYVLAAVTADSAVFVRRNHPEDQLGAMLWVADDIRQKQQLYPDDWRDACDVEAV